jgi:hypothetical protein
LFLHYLHQAFAAGELHFFSAFRHLHEPAAFQRYLALFHGAEWVVYVKRPFAGPAQILDWAIHPPCRDLQQSSGVHRQRRGPLSLEGLPRRQPPEELLRMVPAAPADPPADYRDQFEALT